MQQLGGHGLLLDSIDISGIGTHCRYAGDVRFGSRFFDRLSAVLLHPKDATRHREPHRGSAAYRR